MTASLIGACCDAQPVERYVGDVEFLLAELPKKAGHFFADKGIDWAAVERQFRAEAAEVASDSEHVLLCHRLVCRLRDGHAGLTDLKAPFPDEGQGRRFTGPRLHLLRIGDRLYVGRAFGSAAEAGLAPGQEVVLVDGLGSELWLARTTDRLRDRFGYSTDHMAAYYACHTGLADWEGTTLNVVVASDNQSRRITLRRSGGSNYVPVGPVFFPAGLKEIGRQSYGRTGGEGYAYIHLRDVPGDLPEQLDAMLGELFAAGDGLRDGLILDFRANGGGGCDHAAVFGRFVPAGETWRQYSSAGPKPYGGRLVVIVDAGVRSAGETIAGQFKEDGRALMIGDSATAGTSSQKETLQAPSGLFSVTISVASNKQRFNGGRGIEGLGVPPHVQTLYTAEDLRAGIDSQIRQAEEFLRTGFPEGVVAWEAR